jgi:exonuclease-1
MGIKDLLNIVKPALKDVEVWNFRGQKAVIDVMVWLYKGAYSCSFELALGKPTMNFLSYPVKMLCMLKQKGIKPICVFDGFHLLAKAQTE